MSVPDRLPAPSLALATAATARGLDPDEPLLLAALARRGVVASMAIWDDPRVDWAGFDLVVVRSTWDYVERVGEFHAWLERVGVLTTLANPAAMVRWTLDKHYLVELAAAGVAVVPTTILEPGSAFVAPGDGHYVVKPAIGAGSRDAARYRAGVDDGAAAAHATRLLAAGRAVLVQPYLGRVDVEGELALVCFDGVFSHAARKRVVLPGAGRLVQELFAPEDNAAAVADDAHRALAVAALAAVPRHLGASLYARIDVVVDDAGDPCVLELELAEPSLFLAQHAAAAATAAAALAAAAERAAAGRAAAARR